MFLGLRLSWPNAFPSLRISLMRFSPRLASPRFQNLVNLFSARPQIPGRLRTWPSIPSPRLHRVRLRQAGLETLPSGRLSRIMAASYSLRRAQAAWSDGSSNGGLKAGDRQT